MKYNNNIMKLDRGYIYFEMSIEVGGRVQY